MLKFSRILCLAIFAVASLTLVHAFAEPVTYTNGEIYNAPNVHTDNYDSVNFIITDSSLHSYTKNLSGSGIVNYSGKSVNYYLNLTGNNSALSGTFNVTNAGSNTSLYFSAESASIPKATLVLGDLTYVRTKVTSDATIQIGALEGTGFVRNDDSSGHTITYQLGGANKDATFSGQIMNTWRSDVNNYPVAISKVGSGTQTFAGNNTYSGTTTISEGRLRLIGSGTLGSATSDVTVTSSAANKWAALEFAYESGTIDFSRNIKSNWYTKAQSGGEQTGRFIKSGAATLNLTGNISSTGVETTAGTINFGTASAPNGNALRPGYLSIDNGAVVNYYGGDSGTMTILAGGYSYVGRKGNGELNFYSGSVKTETNDANKSYLKMFIGGEAQGDTASTGTVNIYSGVTYAAGKQEIQVGSWGTGNLNIYGTMTTSALLRLAEHSGGSSGTITVYDGGSLTSNTNLFVGSYGEGLVDVKNGGSVTAKGSVTIGSYGDGAILVESGGSFVSTVNIKLAEHTTNSGTITVEEGGYLKSLDIQVGAWGTGVVNNYGTIEVTDTVKLGRDGNAGSGTVNVYEGATLSAKEIYPGVTMPGTLNVAGGTVTATDIAMHGRGANATGTILITDGGSVTANLLQFGNAGYQSYAVDTTLTLDDGTLSVVNVNYPRDGAYTNKVNATVNLGKGTVITGAVDGVESIWWAAVNVNLTSEEGTTIQVDENKTAIFHSPVAGNGGFVKTGEGTLVLNANNTYAGDTTVEAGTLKLTDSGTFGSGSLTIMDGAIVDVSELTSGAPISFDSLTMNDNSTLKLTLTKSGADWTLSTPYNVDTATLAGNIDLLLTGDEITLDDVGILGTFITSDSAIAGTIASINLDELSNLLPEDTYLYYTTGAGGTLGQLALGYNGGGEGVPEPSTWALLVLGVMGLLFFKKRTNNK